MLLSGGHEIFIPETRLILAIRIFKVSYYDTDCQGGQRQGERASSHFHSIWLGIKYSWDEFHSISRPGSVEEYVAKFGKEKRKKKRAKVSFAQSTSEG